MLNYNYTIASHFLLQIMIVYKSNHGFKIVIESKPLTHDSKSSII